MKLSEMNTVQLERALCELAVPMGNIGKNQKIGEKMREISSSIVGKTKIEAFSEIFCDVLPILLREHAGDLHAIVAALTGKTTDEIAHQNGFQTIKEAKASIDKDFLDFFK